MKKIFMTFSAGTTLAVAIALTGCNNAEQVKKQVDEQNAKIQSSVDEKLNALQEQVNTECATKVDSLATVAYAAWQAEEAKTAKKGGKKPAVKPKPKPVEPKKEVIGDGKPKMGENTKPNEIGNGKPKMGEQGSTGTIGKGKPKMGGGN